MTDQPLNPAAIMAIRERDAEAMSGPANDQLVYRERHALLAEVDRLAAALAAAQERVADAWDEGRASIGLDFTRPMREDGMREATPNPYRAALAGEGAAEPTQSEGRS